MPSGFQQDSNQLSPDFYRVVLTLSGGTGNYGAAAPANGAVNPYDWNSFTTKPTSVANSERLARGNMRWQAIIEHLTRHADAQILDVEVGYPFDIDKNFADNVPTTVAFTVKYDRDAFLLDYDKDGNITGLPSTPSNITTFTPTTGGAVTIDTTVKAIRYLVATAIARNAYTRTYRVYDPADQSESQPSITVNTPDTLADILDDVSVSLIDGTELITTDNTGPAE
jgi:hypothetical protein